MKPTPPMLPGTFLVGHTFGFLKDRHALLQHGLDSFGPVFAIKLLNRPTAILIGPEYHRIFFTESDEKLSSDKANQFLQAAFGEVATSAPKEVYDRQRPVLQSPFKSKKVASYISSIQLEVQQWLDSLGKQGEIDLTSEIRTLVQHIASHALMGKAFRDQMDQEFWKLFYDIGRSLIPALPPNLPLPMFLRRERAKNRLRAMLWPIIAERRAHPDLYDDGLQELVNTHYRDGKAIENETILNLIIGYMFGGHETTTGQTVWTIVQLLQHPEYLRVVQQEIADRLPSEQPIDAKILRSLDHVFWAVKETARMHPSADVLMRRTEQDIEAGAYCIPKGWNLMVSSYIAHQLPTVFTEPHRYDPWRFAPDRKEHHQHRFAMIDFGAGFHKCVGMHLAINVMLIITSLLFQQFDLELVTKDPQSVYGMIAIILPGKTIIRYRRKQGNVVSDSTHSAVDACPYSNSENIS